MEGSVEARVSHEVDLWLRWLPKWQPGTHRARMRLCRTCFGSPVIAAAGLAVDVPHSVQHGMSMRMKLIVDAAVDDYTGGNLPLLYHELQQLERRKHAQHYRPGEGLAPESAGMELDPEPEPGQPFLFTFGELTGEPAAEAAPAPEEATLFELPPDGHSHAELPPDGHSHAELPPDGHSHAELPPGGHADAELPPDGHSHAELPPDGHSHAELPPGGHAELPTELPPAEQPLSEEEKQAIRAEMRLADAFAAQVGSRVCSELAQHRHRIAAGIAAFVEPQVAAMLADLERELDAPSWPNT